MPQCPRHSVFSPAGGTSLIVADAMLDDPTKAVAKIRVINAEKRLLRAVEHLEKQVAEFELEKALAAYHQLHGGGDRGD